jgi:hypothetical protein
METRGPPPGTGHLLHDSHQTPTNSKETYRGDSGHLGPTPRSTPNLERHLERTMGVTMVGRNDITQIRLSSMDSGTQNSNFLPRRDIHLGPQYYVYNGTRCSKTYSQNTHHHRSTTDSKKDHRTILEINGLGEPISQQGTTRERPIMVLLHRNRGMTRESTIRDHLSWGRDPG